MALNAPQKWDGTSDYWPWWYMCYTSSCAGWRHRYLVVDILKENMLWKIDCENSDVSMDLIYLTIQNRYHVEWFVDVS